MEDFSNKLTWLGRAAWGVWASVGISAIVILGAVWHYATHAATVGQHTKAIEKLETQLEKLDGRIDSRIERDNENTDRKVAKVADRLQSWEDKGFRSTRAVFEDGDFIALAGMTIAISPKDDVVKSIRVFTVNPAMMVEVGGKSVQLQSLKLASGTPISFMVSDDGIQVIAIQLRK